MRLLTGVLLILLSCAGALADKMPVLTDTTVTTTGEILARIQRDSMVDIRNKYVDLQKNFTPNFLTTGLDLDCRTGNLPAENGLQYAGQRISAETKTLANGQVQTFVAISHFDCFGKLIFTERIKTIGQAPTPLSVQDAVRFNRFFEIQPGETARQYQIETSRAEIVFSVSSQRLTPPTGERVYTVIEVGGSKWLEFDQLDPSPNERRIFVQLHSGVFKVAGSRFRLNFGKTGSVVLQTMWTDRSMMHFIDGALSNQISFDGYLSTNVTTMTTQMLLMLFSNFIQAFPATQKVQVGVSDSPFLRELQLNYTRTQTNTEQEQVKLFFQKTIQDIKSGRLKVE
jgi:hypothetical protein